MPRRKNQITQVQGEYVTTISTTPNIKNDLASVLREHGWDGFNWDNALLYIIRKLQGIPLTEE